MYAHSYIYACILAWIYVYTHEHMYISFHAYTHIYIYMHEGLPISLVFLNARYTRIFACIYIYIYAYLYGYMHTRIYDYMRVSARIHKFDDRIPMSRLFADFVANHFRRTSTILSIWPSFYSAWSYLARAFARKPGQIGFRSNAWRAKAVRSPAK